MSVVTGTLRSTLDGIGSVKLEALLLKVSHPGVQKVPFTLFVRKTTFILVLNKYSYEIFYLSVPDVKVTRSK